MQAQARRGTGFHHRLPLLARWRAAPVRGLACGDRNTLRWFNRLTFAPIDILVSHITQMHSTSLLKDSPGHFLCVPSSGEGAGCRPGIIKTQNVQLSCFISRNIFTPQSPDWVYLDSSNREIKAKLLRVLEILHHC